jgi:hypothetical protein
MGIATQGVSFFLTHKKTRLGGFFLMMARSEPMNYFKCLPIRPAISNIVT